MVFPRPQDAPTARGAALSHYEASQQGKQLSRRAIEKTRMGLPLSAASSQEAHIEAAPSQEAEAGPASSHAASRPKGKAAIQAQKALATSKGRMRIPIQKLGPAVFNRQGSPTSGKHCIALAHRILREEGFATFRYHAGFCHEPNPRDPLRVARHWERDGCK